MHPNIFEACYFENEKYKTEDFNKAEDAIARIEQIGKGSVIKFVQQKNLPGCKPDIVQRSNALWRYDAGQWTELSIFSGTTEPLNRTKPH